jgi:hypothetical protein
VNVTCPACRAEMSLDVLLAAEDTRQVLAQLAVHTLPFGALTLKYIGLFRPEKRQLTHRRMLALIEELLPDVRRQAIARKGRDWHVGLETWKQGLEAVLTARDKGSLTLPLTSHGYLYEILCGMADKQEAEQERQAQQAPRAATAERSGMPVQVLDAVLPLPPAPVPARPTGPSLAAQKLRAEIAEIKRRREGGATELPPKEIDQ